MDKIWKRKCPNLNNNLDCKKEITYTRKSGKDKADKENRQCKSCTKKGMVFTLEHKNNIKKNHARYWQGKTRPSFSKETRRKLGDTKRGDNNPAKRFEVREKISKTLMGRKRKPFSQETLRKMSEASRLRRIKEIASKYGQCFPNYNPEGCKIIDDYSKKHGYNFQHAENGGEVCIGGYFPDGLDEKRKTIIEIDEAHHFNKSGTLKKKDIKRQKYLESLGYEIIRVKFNG